MKHQDKSVFIPLHRRLDPDLQDAAISSHSCWGDEVWHLDCDVPGIRRKNSSMNWRVVLPDNTILSQATDFVNWMKRLFWSLFRAPCNGRQPQAPTSAGSLGRGMSSFARWMNFRGYSLPSQLDEGALEIFLSDIPDIILGTLNECDDSEEGEALKDSAIDDLSVTQIWTHVRIPCLIWQQRSELAAAGIQPMPAEPWYGRTPLEIAKGLTARVSRAIPPVPDEVAIPILNKVAWFLGTPANDILMLRKAILSATAKSRHRPGRIRAQREAVARFRFSTEPGKRSPWRGPIVGKKHLSGRQNNLLNEVRQLVLDVQNAAMLLIDGTTGMRSAELLGVEKGTNSRTGMPDCIRLERSATGLHEVFFLKSRKYKREQVAVPEEWLLGLRPVDSTELPLTVRAIAITNELLAPEYKLSNKNRLFLQLSAPWGLPVSEASVADLSNEMFNKGMRDFIERYVDLSHLAVASGLNRLGLDISDYARSKGRCIRSAQWRKTVGVFVYRVDPRLIPALSMHFHHLNIAVTEGSYVGRNPAQLQNLKDARVQQTALFMLQMADGERSFAGRMGEYLESHIDELRRYLKDLPPSKAWTASVEFVIDNDLQIWFSSYGNCLPLSSRKMRCHEAAGTTSWRNKEPNYRTREPALCSGCPCFILDGQHSGYWSKRYVEYMTSCKEAKLRGKTQSFEAVCERARQANALLKRLGVDTAPLDAEVNRRVKGGSSE